MPLRGVGHVLPERVDGDASCDIVLTDKVEVGDPGHQQRGLLPLDEVVVPFVTARASVLLRIAVTNIV